MAWNIRPFTVARDLVLDPVLPPATQFVRFANPVKRLVGQGKNLFPLPRNLI